MEDWIDVHDRWPQEGETISLPGLKDKYKVQGPALYNNKGRLSIPLSLVEKYKIENE
jgi:hypothetical protein